MPVDIGSLIGGFDQSRRAYRDKELERSKADQDREFSLLQALATHMDPEIAAIGAAGLLDLAGGGAPKSRKGLSGFLGEVDRSSAMGPLRQFLGAGSTNATAVPGSAAQPSTALVEPEAQKVGAGAQPATFGGGEGPATGGVTAPTFGGTSTAGPGASAPPDFGGDVGPPQFGMPGLGVPPPPPAPETPQLRMRRLFPSAGDIAEETAFRQLQGRFQAALNMIRQAKNPVEQDLALGLAGSPRRQSNNKPMNAQYRTADGQEMEGTVIFDPVSGQAEVDGAPVTILKMLPTNPPRPIRSTVQGPGGTLQEQFRDPNNLNAPPLATVETGRKPPPAPPAYSSIIQTPEGYVPVFRGGGTGAPIADTMPRAGELDPAQQEATGWLADVQAEVKAQLSAGNRTPGLRAATALPVAQQNEIVKRVTKGRYQTIGQLTAATKKTAGGPPEAPQDDARSRANRVRQRLEQAQPSRVQGSGLPPGM